MENSIACTLPDCTFCKLIDPKLAVDFFLQESNAIESVYDQDSLQQARYAWEYLIAEEKLTGGVILKTHKILMLHQKIHGYQRGYWRTEQVGVYKGNKLIRECLDWHRITTEMKSWLYIDERVITAQFPEEWTKQQHIRFELIHPFIDGNGRIGRMLLNWRRLKMGLPLLIIHSENKQDYYKWFE